MYWNFWKNIILYENSLKNDGIEIEPYASIEGVRWINK